MSSGSQDQSAPWQEPAAQARPALRVTDLHKDFGTVTALSGVGFTIYSGEFVTLLGSSGCGKSTILRIVAGIETPTRGSVMIGDRVVNDTDKRILVSPERRDLSMVFQSYAVWPHMSVAANVAFPLRYRKTPRRDHLNLRSFMKRLTVPLRYRKVSRRDRVMEALRAVRMEEFVDRYPHQLSGGQQQRVAVARSIVARPALLLLDEPLSNLDARLREDMRVELKRLHLELGLTMLYVTHDQSEALAMSDRVLVMDKGMVLQEGTPEEVYQSPKSLSVARFLGVRNLVTGRVVGPDAVEALGCRLPADLSNLFSGSVPSSVTEDIEVAVAIRPDGFSLREPGSSQPSLRGDIRLTQFLGGSYEHEVDIEGVTLIARSVQCLGERGDTVDLSLKSGAVMVFPSDR